MDLMTHDYFECVCDSADHTIRVTYFVDEEGFFDEDEIYLETQLPTQPFWQRLKKGLRYIFGYKCKYGHWESTVLKERDAIRLRDLLNRFIDSENRKAS